MAKQASIVKDIFKYLKNKKGQGLVEIAVVVFFSVVIGLAARESGLIDALADTYTDKVQIALGPSGISMSEANASGNQSTGNTSGDGTSGSGSGVSGSGSGNSDSGNSGSGSGNSGSGSETSGSGSETSGSGSETSGSGNETSGSGGGNAGIPAGGQTGEESGKLSPLAYYEKLLKYKQLYKTAQAIDKNDIIWNAYNESDRAVLNLDRDTLFQILLNEWPKKCPGDNVKWADLNWNNWVLLNSLDCTNVWVNMLKPKCENGSLSPKQVWEKLNVYHAMLSTVQSKTKEDVVWEEYLNNDYAFMKLGREDFLGFIKNSDWWPSTPNSSFKWEDINDQSDWRWVKLKNLYYDSGN